jgi:hypothetical protein
MKRNVRRLVAGTTLSYTTLLIMMTPMLAVACEGGGEEGLIDINFTPSELTWFSGEKTTKEDEIKLIGGSDPVKPVYYRRNGF